MKHKVLFTWFTMLCVLLLLLSACGSPVTPTTLPEPTVTTVPATAVPSSTPVVAQPATPTSEAIYFITGQIVQEQGSGDICTSSSTYLVKIDIASSGPATVEYRVDATDGSGQVPNGVFESSNSPEVLGSLTFNGTETQSLTLRLIGPYTYPDSIVVRAYVDNNATELTLVCTEVGSENPQPTAIPGQPEPTATSQLETTATSQPEATATSRPATSGAPTNPILTSYNYSCTTTDATIDFLWTDMSNNEDGFRLYRNETLIATLGPDVTTYSDSVQLSDGKTLSYLLVAFNSAGESAGSPAEFTLNCQ